MALTDNIVAYWKFDEGSGASAADATGNGNTATLTAAPSWVAGKINDGLQFNGSTQYGTFGPLSGNASLSIAAWIKTTMSGSSVGIVVGGNSVTNFQFGQYANKLRMVAAQGAGSYTSFSSAKTVNDGVWHHVVFTCDATSGAAVIYVDGVQDATSTWGSLASVALNSIGRLGYGAGSSYYNGIADEVGVWSRALSAAEVSQLYNSGAGLQYPFTTAIQTVNESITTIDTESATANFISNNTESVTTIDTESAVTLAPGGINETASMADSLAATAVMHVSLVEVMSAIDQESAYTGPVSQIVTRPLLGTGI